MSSISYIFQPLVGINWIANHTINLIYFDVSTGRCDRLVYAKVLVEVTLSKHLPTNIPILLVKTGPSMFLSIINGNLQSAKLPLV